MKIIKQILKFLAAWSEIITIPLGILLWYFSPFLLRMLDPTAATYDAGIFQIILFTIIQFFIYSGVVWIYMKITFPNVYKWLDNIFAESLDLNNDIGTKEKLTKWQKSQVALWLFSLLFLGIILLARII